ncbi:coiled-coil domain-containing protein 152-like isoform X2 [Conger conger]|uniref:coiled-coil domain-containing protein 152-like isoform X2 n=1 Tax=Conger conger TaxID=82655 RepID=UPI002A5A19B3|nr:coiled-coil domain-containing protein 152-like isoform X2 [Conger conger]
MKKSTAVNLDKLIEDFSLVEQKITDMKAKNNLLEVRLDETTRMFTLSQTKEKYLREERDELFQAVIGLQHTLKQQCELRVENEQLKKIISDLERQNNSNQQDSAANMERLKMEVAAQITEQQRDTAEVRGELQSKLEAKELEMQEALQKKESELEQMRKRMKEQEREKQTEIIKLQLEKLQYVQEQRQMEVESLRQRVKELEQKNTKSFPECLLKRRKL